MKYLYVTTTYTRPDISIPWYEYSAEENACFQKYIDNGLMHSIYESISDDGLVKTRSLIWYVNTFPIDTMMINQLIRSDVSMYDFYVNSGEYCKEHNILRSDAYLKVVQSDQSIVHESYIMSEFLF